MAKTANVVSSAPEVDFKKQWRETFNGTENVLVHYVKNRATGEVTVRPVTFSLSASISEQFSLAVDAYMAEQGSDDDDESDEEKNDSRAQFIRECVADRIDYDLSLEPVAEKGAGLEGYRAKVAKAFESEQTLSKQNAALAALLTPEQMAQLQEALANK